MSSENGVSVADSAIQCLGGSGYTTDYPLASLFRDAKLYDIGGGTAEMRKIVIAREIAKLSEM